MHALVQRHLVDFTKKGEFNDYISEYSAKTWIFKIHENSQKFAEIGKIHENSQKLINLLIISSLLSVVTFLLWIAGLKNIDIFSLETLLFAGTGLLMVSILNKIIKLSSEGLLEDFVLGVMKNKELLLRIVVALLLLILGLYV